MVLGWELKVFGYINICRTFYALMKARHAGVIINVVGNAAQTHDPGQGADGRRGAAHRHQCRDAGGTESTFKKSTLLCGEAQLASLDRGLKFR
jgi:hypothetical protein